MGKFTIRHTFNTDVDTFWDTIFFNDQFNSELYTGALDFDEYTVLGLDKHDDGSVTRKLRTKPKSEAPAIVKKLVGDSLTYVEDGRYDPKTRRWIYEITTSTLADKIDIDGEFWLEPRGDKKLERLCTVDLRVKIFGVGRAIESFIEKTTRDSYEKAAAFTNEYIHEHGL